MPARPGVRSRPKCHKHNSGQAANHGCRASDRHSTRHHHGQSRHLGCGRGRRHPNTFAPTRQAVSVHAMILDCSPGPAQIRGLATGNHPGSVAHTGSISIAALVHDDGSVPPGSQPPVGTP
eukprot:994282-Amphidinium_carterae.1